MTDAGREEAFYRNRYSTTLPVTEVDPGQFDAQSRIPGHRYYCVRKCIDDPRSLVALEWGVGFLSQYLFFADHFKAYYALDIAADAIRERYRDVIRKRYGQDEQKYLQQYNLNLDSPFEDGQFDVVIAMMVIEHLFNPFHSFREVARLLRPGGYAFINLPIVTSVKNRARLFFGTLPLTSSKDWWQNEEWDGGHLHYFSIESVRRLSEKYQLELSEMYPCGRLFQLKRVFPTILCNELSFVFRKAT